MRRMQAGWKGRHTGGYNYLFQGIGIILEELFTTPEAEHNICNIVTQKAEELEAKRNTEGQTCWSRTNLWCCGPRLIPFLICSQLDTHKTR